MTSELAATENEIFPKPETEAENFVNYDKSSSQEKNGHRELDEMARVFAETEGGERKRKKKRIKESDGETCEPESEGEKEGGQDKFGGES